jgi:hypothetical protein
VSSSHNIIRIGEKLMPFQYQHMCQESKLARTRHMRKMTSRWHSKTYYVNPSLDPTYPLMGDKGLHPRSFHNRIHSCSILHPDCPLTLAKLCTFQVYLIKVHEMGTILPLGDRTYEFHCAIFPLTFLCVFLPFHHHF